MRAFSSIEGWGLHFLASGQPIVRRSPAEAAQRLPPAALEDLLEWGPAKTGEQQFGLVLAREIPVEALLRLEPRAVALRDEHPVNEYYLLRTLKKRWRKD